jgi:hypothetical protein
MRLTPFMAAAPAISVALMSGPEGKWMLRRWGRPASMMCEIALSHNAIDYIACRSRHKLG